MQYFFDLLNSNDSAQRFAAEEILSELDEPLTNYFLQRLEESLLSERWEIRYTALKLFTQYQYSADNTCFPDSSDLVFDPVEEVRLAAIDYGCVSNTALIDALNDKSLQVCQAAFEALEKRGGLDSGDCFQLAEYLRSADSGLRTMVKEQLLLNGQEQLLEQFSIAE